MSRAIPYLTNAKVTLHMRHRLFDVHSRRAIEILNGLDLDEAVIDNFDSIISRIKLSHAILIDEIDRLPSPVTDTDIYSLIGKLTQSKDYNKYVETVALIDELDHQWPLLGYNGATKYSYFAGKIDMDPTNGHDYIYKDGRKIITGEVKSQRVDNLLVDLFGEGYSSSSPGAFTVISDF